MSRKALLFLCLLFSVFNLLAQNFLTEIKGKGKELEGLKALCRGDSVFLSYYDKIYSNSFKTPSAFRSIWIMPDGSQKEMNLRELESKPFIGATKKNDSSFYYFIEEAKKKVQLKAVIQTDQSDSTKIYDLKFGFTGKLLVSFIENDLLYLLVAEKDELRLTKIKNLQIIGTNSFSILPLDLSKDKKKQFSFIDNKRINRPAQTTDLGKVIKSSNYLFVVVDDPAGYRDEQQASYKTAVVRLDLIDGTVMTKYFFEKSQFDFRSTVFGNKVFRYTDSKNPEVTIYDYLTGTVLKKQLVPARDVKDSLFFRSGKYNPSLMQPLASPRAFICVDSIDSNLILSVGVEAAHESTTVIPVPLFSFYGMGVFAGAVILGDLNGLKAYYFYCLRGDVNTGFQKTTASMLPNQKINNYELPLKDEIKFKHKLYISNTKRIFAIYNEKGNNDLKVLKFER